MPRYFFHVQDGVQYPDLQGTELPDIKAVRKEAVRYAATLLLEHPDAFWNEKEWQMRVTDEADLTLFHLTFFASMAPSTII